MYCSTLVITMIIATHNKGAQQIMSFDVIKITDKVPKNFNLSSLPNAHLPENLKYQVVAGV